MSLYFLFKCFIAVLNDIQEPAHSKQLMMHQESSALLLSIKVQKVLTAFTLLCLCGLGQGDCCKTEVVS